MALCDMKRAMILVALDKAEPVEFRDGVWISGVSKRFPCPSIIRIKTGASPNIKIQLSRKNVLKRDGFSCVYCGSTSELTVDHVVPKSKGGKSTWENLATACRPCNNRKDDKLPHEAGMKLRTVPKMPNKIAFLRQEIRAMEESWKPYLYIT
jgi:5-methylcytosine-specific restriction endonuclease McrA